MKWIKCSDRMPEGYKNVLVYIEPCVKKGCMVFHGGEGIQVMIINTDGGFQDKTKYITHWMSSPEPPVADNQEKE